MRVPARRYWDLLSRYLRPQTPRAVQLTALILTGLLLQLAVPQVVRRFLDGAIGGLPLADLSRLALGFLGIVLLKEGVSAWGRYTGETIGWTATNALRSDLVRHCLGLDLAFHKAHTPGELVERIDGDVNVLSNFFSQLVVGLAANSLLLIGVLAVVLREDWRVGLVLTAFTALALLVLNYTRSLAIARLAEARGCAAQFYGFVGEQLGGKEDVRAIGGLSYTMQRCYRQLRNWLAVQMAAYRRHSLMRASTLLVFVLGNSLTLGLGAWLYLRGTITLGTVYLLLHYTELINAPIQEIRSQLQDLQRAAASIGRVEELFATTSSLSDGPGAELPDGPLAVELRDVRFGYDAEQPVLQGINLRLPPGQALGLLGRTGSGKTTVGRLLARFHDPQVGEVRLGGVKVAEMKLQDLRQRIGLVTQDVQLFNASVRDNLTFFRREITDGRILAVLSELGLDSWLASQPRGLDTLIAAGGGGLSAGEGQLLALARCFLTDPALIILDEASSRLDPLTEGLVEQALDRLLVGRTALIIAHRLETVRRVQQIAILEQGQVVEQGQPAALAADPSSRFYRLLQGGNREVLA